MCLQKHTHASCWLVFVSTAVSRKIHLHLYIHINVLNYFVMHDHVSYVLHVLHKSLWTCTCCDHKRVELTIHEVSSQPYVFCTDRATCCHSADDTDTEHVESTSLSDGGYRPWCHVAYREFRDVKHISSGVHGGYQGSLAVFADDLHIFAGLHDGAGGLCLSALRTAARGSHASGHPCETCSRRADVDNFSWTRNNRREDSR